MKPNFEPRSSNSLTTRQLTIDYKSSRANYETMSHRRTLLDGYGNCLHCCRRLRSLLLDTLTSESTSFRNTMVLSSAKVIITCAHIITRGRNIFIEYTQRTSFIRRSWDREDHVDGHVLQ